MALATFDLVYRAYVSSAEANSFVTKPYEDFPHQPYKLLEAYALAWQAEQGNELLFTSHWQRQQGATTAAIALAMTGENVYILTADTRMAKNVTSRIFKTFQGQGGHIHSHVQPNTIHKRVWWMTGLRQCTIGARPSLVVVDSETAYRDDRDQAVDDLRRFFGCAMLVLDAPRPTRFI